jgi:hypothetical protein
VQGLSRGRRASRFAQSLAVARRELHAGTREDVQAECSQVKPGIVHSAGGFGVDIGVPFANGAVSCRPDGDGGVKSKGSADTYHLYDLGRKSRTK